MAILQRLYHLANVLFKTVWMMSATLIIFIAVLLGTLRTFTPLLQDYRLPITRFASQLLDQPIRIAHVDVGWYRFEPVLKLSQVEVLNSDQSKTLLKIERLSVGIDLFSSIWRRQLEPGLLLLSGADIKVEQSRAGELRLTGFNTMPSKQTLANTELLQQKILRWLLKQKTILFKRLNIHWVAENGTVLPIKNLNIAFTNRGALHQVQGTAELAQVVPSNLRFRGHLYGNLTDKKHWRGQLYVQAKNLLLAQWSGILPVPHLKTSSGELDGQWWFTVKNSQLQDIQAQIKLTHGNFSFSNANEDLFLQLLSGHFAWQKQARGWQLSGDELAVKMNGIAWPNNQFSYQWHTNEDDVRHRLYVQHLKLPAVLPVFLAYQDVEPLLRQFLLETHPKGNLSDVFIQATQQENNKLDWEIKTDFKKLAWQAHEALPAVDNLQGHLDMQTKAGRLQLSSPEASIAANNFFTHPLNKSDLNADISWQKEADRLKLTVQELSLQHEMLETSGVASFVIPDNWRNTEIDSKLGFIVKNMQQLAQSLPLHKLSLKLSDWLNKAVLNEAKTTGSILLRGSLADFPFDEQQGVFMIGAEVSDLDIQFDNNWPTTKDINADFIFRNRDMKATINSGQLLNLPIRDAELTITDIGGEEELHFKGDWKTSSPLVMQLLKNSPVAKTIPIFQIMDLDGEMDLQLAIDMPLYHGQDAKVRGELLLQNSQLSLPDWQIYLTRLNGSVQFNEGGISTGNMQAMLFEEPTQIQMQTQHQENSATTVVDIKSHINADTILKSWPKLKITELAGRSAYQAKLSLAHDDNQKDVLNISSDLVGLKIQLPYPFSKEADEKATFYIKDQFTEKDHYLNFNYQDQLAAHLKLNKIKTEYQLERGELRFASSKALLPKESGLVVLGSLKQFSLDSWLPYLQVTTGGNNASPKWLRFIDLRLSQADLYGQTFSDLDVKIVPKKQIWQLQLQSPRVAGELFLSPTKKEGIRGELQHLHLTSFSDKFNTEEIHPKNIPSLQVRIDDLQYQDQSVGQVYIHSQLDDGQQWIRELSILTPRFNAKASGQWVLENNRAHTQLQGKISTNQLAKVLANWHFVGGESQSALDSERGELSFDLDWQGAPYQFSIHQVQGQLRLQLAQGRISNLDKATEEKLGFGKLLNILSLQALPRRLRFDFSDLTKEGYSFDEFIGHFTLQNAKAVTNDTYAKGSVADISMRGTIGLQDKDYDLLLKVKPHVTSSLPLVATIAGGPLVGVAAFAANKVFSKGVEELSAYVYQISGSWDKPNIQSVSTQRFAEYAG